MHPRRMPILPSPLADIIPHNKAGHEWAPTDQSEIVYAASISLMNLMRSKMSAWLDGGQRIYRGIYAALASQMIGHIHLDRSSRVGNTQCTGLSCLSAGPRARDRSDLLFPTMPVLMATHSSGRHLKTARRSWQIVSGVSFKGPPCRAAAAEGQDRRSSERILDTKHLKRQISEASFGGTR
jgi:hypothetical protein